MIVAIFKECGGNLDLTIDNLLDINSNNNNSSSQQNHQQAHKVKGFKIFMEFLIRNFFTVHF